MNKFAQILKDKVHWILETNETKKELYKRYPSAIIFIDITNVNPQPKIGWGYDVEKNKFTDYTQNKQYKITALNTKYVQQIKLNNDAYVIATRNNDEALIKELDEEKNQLIEAYNLQMEEIQNG